MEEPEEQFEELMDYVLSSIVGWISVVENAGAKLCLGRVFVIFGSLSLIQANSVIDCISDSFSKGVTPLQKSSSDFNCWLVGETLLIHCRGHCLQPTSIVLSFKMGQ